MLNTNDIIFTCTAKLVAINLKDEGQCWYQHQQADKKKERIHGISLSSKDYARKLFFFMYVLINKELLPPVFIFRAVRLECETADSSSSRKIGKCSSCVCRDCRDTAPRWRHLSHTAAAAADKRQQDSSGTCRGIFTAVCFCFCLYAPTVPQ